MPIDIDKSFYNAGSATVSNGGTTVTGFGTLWAQSLRPGDLFGTHVGAGVRIATIVSNTQLELAHAWTGPSQTAAAYEVQLTPYDVGYQQAVRELLTTMASGNLEALASLAGGADKVPYFTGSGAMSLIDLASLGGGGGGAWDALVGTLAGRDQFDGESAGFRVLVVDNGNGQAVVYEKTASGWSVPVPFTGPAGSDGPPNTLEVGSVTEGETAYVVIRGEPPNQVVDFILRRGPKGDTGDVTPAALAAQAAAEDARDEALAAQGGAEGAAATATTKAGEASDSAAAAATSASTATTAAGNASSSEANAAASAATATTKAGEAAASEANAASSASDADDSAALAGDHKDSAESAATAAAADKAAAQTARTGAEAARDDAQDARDDAAASASAAAASEGSVAANASAAQTARTGAESARDDAEDARDAAAGSASAASTSATNAAGSASTATTQAGIATSAAEDTAADRIATAADRAATGADRTAAENAADAAETARDFAHDWAQADEGTPVDGGTHQGFSAYHWSKVAETAAGGGVQQVNGKTGSSITLTADTNNSDRLRTWQPAQR